jgi:hypothetical protein
LINAQSGETGGANLSKNELYSWVQYSLRRDVNIEDSAGASKIGKLQDELLQFVGPTLKTKNVTNLDGGGTGVAITNFLSTDVNTLEFQDNNLAPQTFPFTANGTISFSDTIREDLGDAKFWVYYDYTRRYGGGTTDITISDRGPAAGDATLDSANITLSAGFTGTTAALAANPVATGGINPAQEGDNYIKLAGMVNAANNGVILKVIDTSGNNFLRVNTLDDVDLVDEANTVGAFLETHPLNSPGSLLVDSAGTTVENSGGIYSTLAANNLTDGAFSFTYDYDGNTQKDRVNQNSIGVDPAIVIRALGLDKGSWVQLTGQVIDRIDNNPYSVVSALERNYSDPE